MVSALSYLLVVIELFLLTSYRITFLPDAAKALCGNDAEIYIACINELVKIMLHNGQWSAVKFSIYTFTLTPVIYLLMHKKQGSITSNMLVLTLTLLLIIAATISPPWVELAAAAMSIMLTGLFISKRRYKLKSN